MIDLYVTGNFILKDIAKRKEFLRAIKKDPYDLVIINRSLLLSGDGRIKEETVCQGFFLDAW